MKKTLKILALISIPIFVFTVLFIKFDTANAALFTDNILRPILGNTIVGFFEKTYFNATDKLQQLTDKSGFNDIPEFSNPGIQSAISPIPPINGLPRVQGEGIWKVKSLSQFPNKNVMAYTFVRPDPSRPFAYVTLAQMDMTVMNLGVTAGTKQPGGPIGNPGPGTIPGNIIQSGKLVAAFDGGFQYRDGNYGMIVDGVTYVPLKNEIGTLVGYKNGILKIATYNGQDLGPNVAFVRQNCPILVENGQIFADNEFNKKLWGRTFNADIYTWRSGVGLTKEGNLIYAVGNNLSPQSLATALKMGGAVDAIQLDINPFWVRFNIFEPNGMDGYRTSTLIKALKDGSKDYLGSYTKDFFFLYMK